MDGRNNKSGHGGAVVFIRRPDAGSDRYIANFAGCDKVAAFPLRKFALRIGLMLFALIAGALQPLQAAVNSQFAQRGATVLWATAISAGVTCVIMVAAALLWRLPPPSPRFLASAPPILWTGGIIGAVVIGMMAVVAPRLGTALMFVCFVAGIIACSLILDQTGAFGLPQQSLTLGRGVGAVLIVAAVVLIRFF